MSESLVWLLLEAVYHLTFSLDFAAGGVSCLSNPCLNGICIDDLNSNYSCYCIDGYTGIQCQTNWDECWSAPCKNGGTCIDGIASYNCSCADGFVGDNCEVNYNECESSPCYNNATCVDLTNGYVCACAPGYSGQLCELDVAVCNVSGEVRCLNGGQCVEGPGFRFSCRCIPGWTGKKCEEPIDECASSPCQNGGICIDAHADYMCACTFGHTGKNCETHVEFCTENSCSNNALCVLEEGVRVCYCVPDYHGERCQFQYDECQLGPRCMNGGTCIDGVDNFTCSCPPRLSGLLCECLLLDDGTLDCEYVSPTPLPGSSTISTFVPTDSDTFTTLLDLTTTTHLPEITTSYNLTVDKTTTWEITTDLTTIHDMITKFTETTTLTTLARTDSTTSEDTTKTTAITFTTSRPDQTEEELETTTALSEISTYTYTGIASEPEVSVTELVSDCGEVCHEATSNTTLTSREFDSTTVTTHLDTTISTFVTISSTAETEDVTIVDLTTKQTVPEARDLDTTTLTTASISTTSDDITTTSTGRWFTDSPLEGNTTLLTTETTPHTEAPTIFDNLTEGYTTVLAECSDSYCNNRGSCILTPNGFRCLCHFNYGGEYCEERVSVASAAFGSNSYLAHKLRNEPSVHVAFTARTLVTEGQILYVDIAPGIYVQLYLSAGLLKFKFSCGYQTMLLSELKTFLNNGFHIKIETLLDLDMQHQHCNASLRLNDTVAMSGGQVANITTLAANFTLYLGNAPAVRTRTHHDQDIKPFVGCVQDLVVNGEARHLLEEAWEAAEVRECASLPCLSAPCLNGGSCVDRGAHYTCACANGFLGEQCERSVCERSPCQFGGTCVRYPGSGFLCLCPFGKHGMLCEYSLDITRPSLAPIIGGMSSYVTYPLTQAVSSERFDLRFRFHTTDMEQISLLAFVGQRGAHDSRSHHLAVTFVKGYIMLTWNLGSGARRIFTPRPLSERRTSGHAVRVGRRGRAAWLSVDARFNVSGNAPGSNTRMEVAPVLYVGGHPSVGFRDLPHDLPLHRGWSGCVWEVGGAAGGGGVARAVGGRGAGQCGVAQCHAQACTPPNGVCIHHPATYGCVCNEGWFGAKCDTRYNPCDHERDQCRGFCVLSPGGDTQCDCPYGKTGRYCDQELVPTDVLFTGVRSYIKLRARNVSSVSLALEAEVKPLKARGLVLFADTASFHTALSLQGGLLEYRWTDKTSGMVSVVRSGVVVSMEQWHAVKAGRYGSRLYVWVDGTISTQSMAAHTYPHTSALTTFTLGGERDLSSLPHDVMSGPPEHYTGCLRGLHINNVLLPLEQHNIQEGVNVADCDGTVCGGEVCEGGACRVEGGRAVCACSGGGGGSSAIGSRCRRHAPCRAPACAPPRGKCRRDACVCAAGYAGENCTQEINITTPHFSGESLMLIKPDAWGSDSRERIVERPGADVEEEHAAPELLDYISLNFTTAEPHGLLLWVQVDNGYMGVGLEEGFLKIIWSYPHRSKPSHEILHEERVDKSARAREVSTTRLPQAGVLADAEWHVLHLWVNANNFTVSVDGNVAHHAEPGVSGDMQIHNAAIFIGGVSEDSPHGGVVQREFRQNFRGCAEITTRLTGLLRNYNNTALYSENVQSCQLFPHTSWR